LQTISGFSDHTARQRDVDFHWLEWGHAASPPMVLLHGLTGHAHIWDHMAPHLAERYHLYALDQRGHGDTGHPPTYTTQDFVDDLEAMRAHWGIERFVLMGLSMGGHNGMAYAAQYPERVARLIVIDIPPRLSMDRSPTRPAQERLARDGHGTYSDFEDAVRDARPEMLTAPEENLRYRTYWNLRRCADGSMQFKYDARVQVLWQPADLTPALAKISCPMLLVRGGKTYTLPRDVAASMVAAVPDAELIEVPESGHSVPTDRPEDLTPIVLDWLARRGT
jgi:pimeloyl-ACP methyl ester carboxylesterase